MCICGQKMQNIEHSLEPLTTNEFNQKLRLVIIWCTMVYRETLWSGAIPEAKEISPPQSWYIVDDVFAFLSST